ncbi:Hca operon transcriptional activator [Variovorax sp. PBS-H4]|uniref:LysR substrate-binding domain-containing protein n=1 Tax=Variovorax sp. PBS-H4 TaxID=434008 RepID=UPI001319A496|nr:LysR substrate-binding domain-containing protein [Variovorax sp. PBS-H4]VTU32539.1 Hca operon transcriptional activator [Variovorax sp. PBS-H4]
MDLRSMRQFIAVAEELNFRRAAERLHMSQPPLSIAIQRLEEDLGVALFLRDRQGVALTPAGSALLVEARRLLAQAAQSRELVRHAAAGMLGTLRLSFFPSAAYQLVPELLSRFRQNYPDVKIMLNAEASSQQSRDLLRHSIDIAIVVPPLPGSGSLKLLALADEDLALAVPASHPLAGQKSVELKTLSHEGFVSFRSREGPAFETFVVTACRNSGFLPHVEQSAPQMLTVLSLVSAGVGIALVPASMQGVAIPRVKYMSITHNRARLRYPVALAYDSQNQNPTIPAFLSTASRKGR